MGRAITRIPLNSVEGLFETPGDQYLGVFCLARGKQADAPTIKNIIPASDDDIHWNTHPYSKWMDNVPAKVTKDGSTSAVTFEKECYYPFGNWYYYDFFAYYPRQDNANVATGWSYVDVNITIDGRQDIIWGQAIAEDNSGNRLYVLEDPLDDTSTKVYAYSAKYFRLAGTGTVPSFAYEHKLTQLVFYVQPHEGDADGLHEKGIVLSNLKLTNVYKKLLLTVASKTTSFNSGTLIISDNNSYGDMKVWNDDTDPTYPIYIAGAPNVGTDASKKLVGYAMLPPWELIKNKTHNKFEVNVLVKQTKNGEDDVDIEYYNKTITLTQPEGGFKAGEKYEIVLDINKKDE